MGRSSVGSLLNGFGAGYEMTGRVMRDSELARIAQSAPTEIPDPSDPNVKRVSFLGKTYDSAPDQTTIDRGRQLAMAGVFDKHGEVQRGSELRQSVRRDEIADQGLAMQRERFDWEKRDQAARGEAQRVEAEWQKSRRAVFNNTAIGQRSTAYSASMAEYEAKKAQADADVAAGKRDVVFPSPPAVTAPTVGESILLTAEMLANDAQYGKADPNAFLKLADLGKQVADEGYTKTLTLAQAGAPLTQVIAQFNGNGQVKVDPASVIADKMVDRGAGVKSRVITFKGPDGKTQTIDTLAELDAIGKADKIFTRAYAANADQRGANADARGAAAAGRASQEFSAGAPARELSQTLAKLQTERLQPTTTPERRADIDTLLTSAKGADQNAPAQVKLAEAFVRAGLKPDMRSALEFAMTSKDKSPEAMKADIYKAALTANMGNSAAAKKATDEAMAYLGDGSVSAAKSAPGATTRASFASAAEAEAAAKAGKIQPGDRITIGGQAGTWR